MQIRTQWYQLNSEWDELRIVTRVDRLMKQIMLEFLVTVKLTDREIKDDLIRLTYQIS